MNATIYWNRSDKRYINKTLEKVKDIQIQFLEDSSVIDARFKLSTPSNALQGNYIFVPDLARYYYINNYIVSKGYIILECHVDVLMSYKDEILSNDVILDRQQTKIDLYQVDNEYVVEERTCVTTIKFGRGFSDGDANFILCVAGNNGITPS